MNPFDFSPHTVTFLLWLGLAAVAMVWGMVCCVRDPKEVGRAGEEELAENDQSIIYSVMADEFRFGMTQQWNTAYYSLLLLAAIAGITQDPNDSPTIGPGSRCLSWLSQSGGCSMSSFWAWFAEAPSIEAAMITYCRHSDSLLGLPDFDPSGAQLVLPYSWISCSALPV